MPGQEEGSPRLPSAYSIAMAARYWRSWDRGASEPMVFPSEKSAVVWDHYVTLWYDGMLARSSFVGVQSGSNVESHT